MISFGQAIWEILFQNLSFKYLLSLAVSMDLKFTRKLISLLNSSILKMLDLIYQQKHSHLVRGKYFAKTEQACYFQGCTTLLNCV